MDAELLDFYGKLIGVVDPKVVSCSSEWLKDLLGNSLPVDAERILEGEVSDREIKEALFRQRKDKSLGPDGYTSWFFKVAWEIVHKDFLSAMRILVSRLAQFFPKMISASQSAFVKGRSITDNTLLAQEIVRGYSRKNLSPRCAIKVDMQKAFDSFSWDFLLNVMGAMALPARFCAKGVRQGDPLSPYLFVIVMNVLSKLLDAAAKNGVTSILNVFYELFGLKLNVMKTELFTCGINGDDLVYIQRTIGFRVGQLPVRYLGVPLVTRKLSKKDCAALLGRIKDKLRQWSSRKLSFGGRLQFIKAVLFSIFNYWSMKLIKLREEARRLFTASVCWSQVNGSWIWDKIREKRSKVAWHRIIWFPAHIPKFSLITWMATLDRLLTKERLSRFGMVVDANCVFCGAEQESRTHIFLDCSFSNEV
ncbi:uncharacterized protein LOC120154405 [Hibiscus syriacus]|uniref:uncharacterized protein LOC120154405 n=1 Tax=Hibiscus syriacus TaxID=106335 RepID=UPI0019240385|nr:uncharacterized protein LOC120154405 [Hibiscus syriacus]